VDGETQYWKVVYCAQKPSTYIAVCRLHPADDYSAHRIPIDSSVQDFASAAYDIAFRCNFGVMSTAADMPAVTADQLAVLFNLKHEGWFL
jgi:CTP:molybdopterin cytidylyltransferase MocA